MAPGLKNELDKEKEKSARWVFRTLFRAGAQKGNLLLHTFERRSKNKDPEEPPREKRSILWVHHK